MYPIRMRFEKSGLARYISHLDLMRCFERTLRRADIPFWFTEGFNPRPFLTFALPLSLGYSGLREAVDIKLTEEMSESEIIAHMNPCLPSGLKVISAGEPVNKAKEIAFSSYDIIIEGSEAAERLKTRLSAGEVTAQKQNKKKQTVTIDIKHMIKDWELSVNNNNDTVLKTVLASGCTETCNPSLVFSPVLEQLGTDEGSVSVTRTDILLEDLSRFV